MTEITVKAEFIFEFTSMREWVDNAAEWFRPYKYKPTICLNKNSDVCYIVEDFTKSKNDDLFPIKVYRLIRSADV